MIYRIKGFFHRIRMSIRAGTEFFKYPNYHQPWEIGDLNFDRFHHYHTCMARMMGAETFNFICPILNGDNAEEIKEIKSGGIACVDGCDHCLYDARVDYDVDNNKPCLKFSVDRCLLADDTFLRKTVRNDPNNISI